MHAFKIQNTEEYRFFNTVQGSNIYKTLNILFMNSPEFTQMSNRYRDENERMSKPRGKHEKEPDVYKANNPEDESPLIHQYTLSCSSHHRHQKHIFTQISSQATSSSQLLMRLRREQHRCPLWCHQLLTELKPLSSESDHSREACCYMRVVALVKTKQ